MLKVEDLIKELNVSDVEKELHEYEGYVCDAISEIASNNTSIYYADIIKFISEHVEEVGDTIEEFGWEGCGSDLYKAGQLTEQLYIEREFNISNAVYYTIYNTLLEGNINEISEDVESGIQDIVSKVDSNDRIDCILDEVQELLSTDSEEDSEEL